MKMKKDNDYIMNYTFDEICIGDRAEVSKTFTSKDIELFSMLSEGINPIHTDEEHPKNDPFYRIVAHGMWSETLISMIIATKLPGAGTVYLSQTLKFMRPIDLGDTITAQLIVIRKERAKNRVELDCKCFNQKDQEVITGTAEVIAPTQKIYKKQSSAVIKSIFSQSSDDTTISV